MNLQYVQIDRNVLTKCAIVADALGLDPTLVVGMVTNMIFHASDLADPKMAEPDVFKTKNPDQWLLRACSAVTTAEKYAEEHNRETFASALRDAFANVSLVVPRDNAIRVPGLKRYFDAEKNRDASRAKANERNRKWRESQKNKAINDALETISETSRDAPKSEQSKSDQNRTEEEKPLPFPKKKKVIPALNPEHPATQFFLYVEGLRRKAGYIGDDQPHPLTLETWYREAMMELNGDEQRLKDAFDKFGSDDHWLKANPPFPFTAFMSEWRKYVPRKAA